MSNQFSSGPKQRLVEAAQTLFYKRGVATTSLAEIAQLANVPTGNVYYHFKSKELLIEAVLQMLYRDLGQYFEQIRLTHIDPILCLKQLLFDSELNNQMLVQFGCPYSAMSHDLGREESQLTPSSSQLLELYVEFAQQQFQQTKLRNEASELAETFVALLQGAYSIGHGLGSSQTLSRQIKRIEVWLNDLF